MKKQQLAVPPVALRHEKAVREMYNILSSVLKECGINELTEGRYQGNPARSYAVAQELQQEYLLRLARLKTGDEMLDIGCGHGLLLQEAKRQGISGKGITLSQKQLEDHQDLDTCLLNWRKIPEKMPGWKNQFDGVCAIGSLEHFVSPQEAAGGIKNDVYLAFFEVCRWLLKPGGRLVVTAIHYLPNMILRPKMARNQFFEPWRWCTPDFHLGSVAWLGGAYYPTVGELVSIAKRCGFLLNREEDGTKDYYLTSEVWIKKIRSALLRLKFSKEIFSGFKSYPLHTIYGFLCIVLFQSWNWQFRDQKGQGPPTQLMRYVWERK